MAGGGNLWKHGFDGAGGTDQEGCPFGSHGFPSVEVLFDPDSVVAGDGVVGVTDERERQVVFENEPLVACGRVGTDSEEGGAGLDFRPCVAEAAGLGGAAGGGVLGIEVEDDALAAQAGESDGGVFRQALSDGRR